MTFYQTFLDYQARRNSDDYIRIPLLENYALYQISARNAEIGIWLENKKGFLIARTKFNLPATPFIELHWDVCESYGTAKPFTLIENCPQHICKALDDDGYHKSEEHKASIIMYLESKML